MWGKSWPPACFTLVVFFILSWLQSKMPMCTQKNIWTTNFTLELRKQNHKGWVTFHIYLALTSHQVVNIFLTCIQHKIAKKAPCSGITLLLDFSGRWETDAVMLSDLSHTASSPRVRVWTKTPNYYKKITIQKWQKALVSCSEKKPAQKWPLQSCSYD